ncbi:MAG: hypothetical protein ACD_16C00122G0001, partial [uncultured bacterium]
MIFTRGAYTNVYAPFYNMRRHNALISMTFRLPAPTDKSLTLSPFLWIPPRLRRCELRIIFWRCRGRGRSR